MYRLGLGLAVIVVCAILLANRYYTNDVSSTVVAAACGALRAESMAELDTAACKELRTEYTTKLARAMMTSRRDGLGAQFDDYPKRIEVVCQNPFDVAMNIDKNECNDARVWYHHSVDYYAGTGQRGQDSVDRAAQRYSEACKIFVPPYSCYDGDETRFALLALAEAMRKR